MFEGGIAKMRDSISNTAEYGDYTRGPRVIGEGTSARRMRALLGEIQDGALRAGRGFAEDRPPARPQFQALRRQGGGASRWSRSAPSCGR